MPWPQSVFRLPSVLYGPFAQFAGALALPPINGLARITRQHRDVIALVRIQMDLAGIYSGKSASAGRQTPLPWSQTTGGTLLSLSALAR